MNRKALPILLLLLILVVSGCVSSWREYRQSKYKSEPTDITFHYPWEQVYNAYYYVLRNTAMPPIRLRTALVHSRVHLYEKEKKIVVSLGGDVEWDITFMPAEAGKTRVHIVKGTTVLRVYIDDQEETVDILSDEVHFVLRNKGQGYYEYTTANALKWDEEGRSRQTMRRYDDLSTPPR